MDGTITQESLASLHSLQHDSGHNLSWPSVFALPAWLETWWQSFGPPAELYLRTVRQGKDIIGIAPLMIKDKTAAFIGSADVCDYLDFIVTPGRETEFFQTLLDDLKQQGIRHLDMVSLRPDSAALTHLTGIAREREYEVNCRPEEVSLDMALPATWEDYLAGLVKKQRHEVKRKLRRLSEVDNVAYYFRQPDGDTVELTDAFLKLFGRSRQEKADFMTGPMEAFFKSLAGATAREGLLRYGILELDDQKVAMIMCFDYNNNIYLYNSAVDPDYGHLSAGLMSKVLGIKEGIQNGKKRWDFLKGRETYKYHLGGEEIPLNHCRVTIR